MNLLIISFSLLFGCLISIIGYIVYIKEKLGLLMAVESEDITEDSYYRTLINNHHTILNKIKTSHGFFKIDNKKYFGALVVGNGMSSFEILEGNLIVYEKLNLDSKDPEHGLKEGDIIICYEEFSEKNNLKIIPTLRTVIEIAEISTKDVLEGYSHYEVYVRNNNYNPRLIEFNKIIGKVCI